MTLEAVNSSTGELGLVEPSYAAVDDWIPVLAAVGDLASKICQTPFVPDGFRNNPAATAAAILTGREMNLGPMMSLKHLHVIKGHVGMSAELMRGMALKAGHQIEVDDATDTRCVLRGRRRGGDTWTEVIFTADQAKRARIDLGQYPVDKLFARASSRLCRRIFPDAIGGLSTVDEIEDLDAIEAGPTPTVAPQPAPARRTAKRDPVNTRGVTTATREQRAAAPVAETPEPSLDDESAETTADQTAGEVVEAAASEGSWEDSTEPPLGELDASARPDPDGPASEGQTKALFATLADLGYRGDRDKRLRLISALVERDITSTTDLTRRDVTAILDTFAHLGRQPDPKAALQALLVDLAKSLPGKAS